MSLLIHLPLMGNLKNYGLRQDLSFKLFYRDHYLDENETNNIGIEDNGKIGQCYRRFEKNTLDCIRSSAPIHLVGDFSMCCWAKITDYGHSSSANGIITNHSHTDNAGAGINLYCASETDFRICCSTGNGMNRTFHTYYGTTNIKDSWHHLCLTYDNTNGIITLYVDGVAEKVIQYYLYTVNTYFDLFNWSTTHVTSSSYRPPCQLNDVRVYDHCLTKKEIKNICNGLILHYKLTDIHNTTTIPDCTEYEHNGILHNTNVTYEKSFHYDNALTLYNNYITNTITADPENVSISMWLKCGDIPSTSQAVVVDGHSSLAFGFYNNGSAIITCSDGTHKTNVCGGIKLYWHSDKWNHVVVVKLKNQFTCYINGIPLSPLSSTNYWTHLKENELVIGCRYNGSYTTNFNGSISDFRYYTKALTSEEIVQLYNTPISADKNGILYAYELLENTNNVSNLSANGDIVTDTFTNIEHNNKLQIFKTAIQATDFIEH